MTEEPTSGTVVGDTGVRGLDARTSEPTWEHEEYHGRPVSWVAVTIIIIGFIIGGIALPIGPILGAVLDRRGDGGPRRHLRRVHSHHGRLVLIPNEPGYLPSLTRSRLCSPVVRPGCMRCATRQGNVGGGRYGVGLWMRPRLR